MKKFGFLIVVIFTTFILGCSATTNAPNNTLSDNNKVDTIPEPYKLACENLSKGDIKLALKYLELTKKDYKKSDYIYDVYILESQIYRIILLTSISINNDILEGSKKGVYVEDKDINQIKKYIKQLDKEIDEITPKFIQDINFIITNYNDTKIVRNTYDISFSYGNQTKDFSWFKDIGYPVPTEEEFNETKQEILMSNLDYVINNNISGTKITYINYFYNMATGINQINEKKKYNLQEAKLLQNVMNLTSIDKYNETRLKAEDLLKEMQK